MILADAVIGDEGALRAKPEPDSLWDAGKRSSQCRPDGAVKDPDRFQALPAQQRDQPDRNDAALQFRSGMRSGAVAAMARTNARSRRRLRA